MCYVFKHKGKFLLLLMVLGIAYVYGVYRGYLLLNYPSKTKYPIAGVDLSHYQGDVDWSVLSQQNIRFAYIKATEGSSHVDSRFAYNWEEAQKTDLKQGAYHFFSFDSPGDTQAANFISQVNSFDGMLAPAIDVEYYADKKVNPPDPKALRENLQRMLDLVEEHYQMVPVIYSTEEVWEAYLQGYFDEYPLWIRSVFRKPRPTYSWTFWQYSNRGRLKGYRGDEEFIDLNVFYGKEETWEAWSEKQLQ